ncbi:hypothetical protein [Mesorhizobium sp. 43Arga]
MWTVGGGSDADSRFRAGACRQRHAAGRFHILPETRELAGAPLALALAGWLLAESETVTEMKAAQ